MNFVLLNAFEKNIIMAAIFIIFLFPCVIHFRMYFLRRRAAYAPLSQIDGI